MEDVKTMDENNKVESPVDTPKVSDIPKYDQEELLRIFDEIIFSGEYSEEVTIKGKLKVVFKARSAEETTIISREIDGKNFSFIATAQEHRALLNLAYSLVSYAGKDLSKVSIEDRRKVVNRLPAAIVASLSSELSKFDLKVDLACREGEVNF